MPSESELDLLAPLPAGTNLIHVGPEKTGSTAIQSAFAALRPELSVHGVSYPGHLEYPRAYLEGLGFHGMRGAPPRDPAEWPALLAELAENTDKRVLISHEQLGRATDEQMEQVVRHLGGERPQVMMVARRYDSYIPSQWQQGVKARISRGYEDYLRLVMEPESEHPLWQKVWVPHDTVALAQRWAAIVGLEAVTVVVADESDRAFLPGVFERLFALPQGMVASNVTRANRSLTYPEVELLRQFVISMKDEQASLQDFHRLMRKGILREVQAHPAPPGEARVPWLPTWAMDRVRERSAQRITGLTALRNQGLRIIGDVERIRVPDDAPTSEDMSPPGVVSMETALRFNRALARAHLKNRRRAKTRVPAPVPPESRSLGQRIRSRWESRPSK